MFRTDFKDNEDLVSYLKGGGLVCGSYGSICNEMQVVKKLMTVTADNKHNKFVEGNTCDFPFEWLTFHDPLEGIEELIEEYKKTKKISLTKDKHTVLIEWRDSGKKEPVRLHKDDVTYVTLVSPRLLFLQHNKEWLEVDRDAKILEVLE